MAKSVGQRVRDYRERMAQTGLVSLSLVVPVGDAAFFREMSRLSRRQPQDVESAAGRPKKAVGGLSAKEVQLAERWANRSGLKLRLDQSSARLSEVLARNIAHEIALGGWPVGASMGTTSALLHRYGVNRTILVEAVRILEAYSVVTMRRGPLGGIFVAEPTHDKVAFSVGVFLEARHFSAEQMLATRRALELHMLDRCLQRFDAEAHEALKQCLLAESELDESASGAQLQQFHRLLARLTGDPSLEIFLDVLLRKGRFETNYYRMRKKERAQIVARVRRSHAAIARALIVGDRVRAARVLNRYFDAYVDPAN